MCILPSPKSSLSRRLNSFFSYLLILFSWWLFTGCSFSGGYHSPGEEWKYREGFDPAWITHSSSSGWMTPAGFQFETEGNSGEESRITLRFRLPERYARQLAAGSDLSLYLNDVTAEKVDIYLDNRLVKTVEDTVTPWINRPKIIMAGLPAGSSCEDVPAFLYLVLSSRAGRPNQISGPPVLGETEILYRNYYGGVVMAFMIIAFYLLAGIYHLLLGIRSPVDRFNIYFGIFALVFALFQTTNAPGKELLWQNHMVLMAAMDRISLKIATASLVLFFSSLFRSRITLPALLVSSFSGILIIQEVLILFGNWGFFMIKIWYPAGISAVLYIAWLLFSEVRKKNLNALILSAGSLCIAAGVTHDILITERIIAGNLISQYLILILFAGTALMLISQFIDARKSVESTNRNLESIVRRRTDELLAANEKIASITRRKLFLESYDLTFREQEILQLILDGLSTSGMADKASISPRTVEKHIQHIYEKLSVHSRMEILAMYNRF